MYGQMQEYLSGLIFTTDIGLRKINLTTMSRLAWSGMETLSLLVPDSFVGRPGYRNPEHALGNFHSENFFSI